MTDNLQYAYIKDVKPSQKNLNVIFIVLEVGAATRTKDNHTVRSCKVADKTGSINISIWDEIGELVCSGDICKLVKGYTNIFKNCLTLYAGKNGGITKIGEFCLQFTETPNMSEPNPDYANPVKNKEEQANQRKSPTELDGSGGNPLSQLNNPGGRGSPPVRPGPGQQPNRNMGNGQNFNQNRQQRPSGQSGQGQRSNYSPNIGRGQQGFQGNVPQGRGQGRQQGQGQNTQNRGGRR
ncbi:SOSS complex subunit B1-like [Mya arenaria]|uniref:SOSS complex subunit B1-like n=1 Tax=Mya arenaria TaxID=6604 RepID=UPI0022E67A28|nr:SOSS complex subunit B1-like [Mya arenaria]XP_052817370.1 SOSS complex subunit B1-like [Mya arenaria]